MILRKNVKLSTPQLTLDLIRLLESLIAYQPVQRRRRADKTEPHRNFIKGVAFYLFCQLGKAPPSAIKPLGALIDCEPDDRNWAFLIAWAKRYWQNSEGWELAPSKKLNTDSLP